MTKATEPVRHRKSPQSSALKQQQPAPDRAVGQGNETPERQPADEGTVARLEAENADLKDRLLRALAEVENVRRRAARDVDDARKYAISRFAGDIVGVADNMERALASASAPTGKRADALGTLVAGIQLTEKELQNVLLKHGIRKLAPIGQRFDPNFHEALFEMPDDSMPSGAVSQVVEPGYAIGDRPLRPAKVGVARNSTPTGKTLSRKD